MAKNENGGASKDAMTLRNLLVIKLGSLYDAESQILNALPKMAKNAADPDLRKAFENHEKQTELQVERLEKAFEELELTPKKVEVEAVRGLIADAEWCIDNIRGPQALDASLIGAARYVEHYEMAGYMVAIEWADLLGLDSVVDLLTETLDEEKETDDQLDEIATSKVNEAAIGDGDGDMVEE